MMENKNLKKILIKIKKFIKKKIKMLKKKLIKI